MPWVRFDDQYPTHRKVAALTDAAYRFHSAAIFWCGRNLMDGWVPQDDLDQVCAQVRNPARILPELLRRGLAHEAGHVCPSKQCPADGSQPDGWVLHDYYDYQPSKAKVVAEREAKAKRQARWLAQKRRPSVDNPDALSTADSSGRVPHSPNRDGTRDASVDGSKDDAPPRPAPKGSGAGAPQHNGAPATQGGAPPCDYEGDREGTCRRCGLPHNNQRHRRSA